MKRRIIYFLVAVAALLMGDAIYIAAKMPEGIARAARGLEAAAESLGGMRLDAARGDLGRARAGADQARRLTSHPAYRVAEIIPWVGGNARAVAAASEAVVMSSDAGLAAVDGIEAVGAGDRNDLVDALYRRGRVRFGAVDDIVPFAVRADGLLTGALEALEDSPEPTLDSIRPRMAALRERVEAAAEASGKLHALLEALPAMAGRSERRHYLLVFQTNSEGRGGGGMIGAYGVLDADDGRLRLADIGPIRELLGAPVRVEDAPAWFESQYGFADALTDVRQSNLSPHFPATAENLLEMYRQITGTRADGVIAMDAPALADLTRATGPVAGRGWGIEVGPDNARDVLLRDAYLHFEREADQERYVESVIGDFWRTATTQKLEGPALLEGLADAVAGRNFQVYAPTEKDALRTLEADGSIAGFGPNVLMVFHNHLATNKTDFFLKRTVRTEVRLRSNGSAGVVTKVVLANRAPAGPPSDLLGHGRRAYEVGSNAMYLTVVLPEGARIENAPDGARRGTELRFPSASVVVDLAPGERRILSFGFEIPRAVDLDTGDPSFTYTLVPQATPIAERYSLTVTPPPGYEIRAEGATGDAGGVTFAGVLETPVVEAVRLVP